MLRDAIHLSLKLVHTDWSPAVICDELRFAQIIRDFVFDLTLRDNCIQWRFRPGILFRPDPVSPIDLFDPILVRYALGKRKRPPKLLLGLGTRKSDLTARGGRHSNPEQTRAARAKKEKD